MWSRDGNPHHPNAFEEHQLMSIYACNICSKPHNHARALAQHVSAHSLTSHNYYDLHMKKEGEGECALCGHPTPWRNMGIGYQKYCSSKCSSKVSAQKQWEGNDVRRTKFSKRLLENPMVGHRPKGSKNKNKYPMTEAVLSRFQNSPPPSWAGKTHTEETKNKMSAAAYERMERIGMPKQSYKGRFQPKHPEKYKGDPTNIIWRSLWELKVMKRLDENPNVLEWSSEETVVPYYDPSTGRNRRYFPDMVAKMKLSDGSIKTRMIEIKPKKETIEPIPQKKKTKRYITEVTTWATNSSKWKYAKEYCSDRGWEFMIITEDHIFGKKD
jgi:hypothetical protein